jgi:hypothetical protein
MVSIRWPTSGPRWKRLPRSSEQRALDEEVLAGVLDGASFERVV